MLGWCQKVYQTSMHISTFVSGYSSSPAPFLPYVYGSPRHQLTSKPLSFDKEFIQSQNPSLRRTVEPHQTYCTMAEHPNEKWTTTGYQPPTVFSNPSPPSSSSHEPNPPSTTNKTLDTRTEYITGVRLVLALSSITLCYFVVMLDTTVLATVRHTWASRARSCS